MSFELVVMTIQNSKLITPSASHIECFLHVLLAAFHQELAGLFTFARGHDEARQEAYGEVFDGGP